MTTPPDNLLFVYGTLLSGDTGKTGRAQRARLAREARVIGIARTVGQLWDLGRYPALRLSATLAGDTPAGEVHGELLELTDPERCLKWLDAYEGIVPGDHTHNDYERVIRPIVLDAAPLAGMMHRAWVYVWRAELSGAAQINDGRWLAR